MADRDNNGIERQLTFSQVMDSTGLSRYAVRKAIRNGDLTPTRPTGARKLTFSVSAVRRWLDGRTYGRVVPIERPRQRA